MPFEKKKTKTEFEFFNLWPKSLNVVTNQNFPWKIYPVRFIFWQNGDSTHNNSVASRKMYTFSFHFSEQK